MKRRLTKKWINRYITPLLSDLPMTIMCGWEVDKGDGEIWLVEGKNHSIKNGYIVDEGCIVPPSTGMRKDIIRASQNIRNILNSYKTVYIRLKPTVSVKMLRMRLITEKVT